MKPLRDQAASPDPLVARAATLVAAMRPLDPDSIRRPLAPRAIRPRSTSLPMRIVLIVPALVLGSAVAAAATRPGADWLRSLGTWARASSRVSPAPPALAPVAPAAGGESTTRATLPAAPEVVPIIAPPTGLSPHAPAPAIRGGPRSARASVDPVDESALVVEAVRALRRDHDSRRARALAEEALHRFPHGAQCEEATAVAMEAASGDGDTTAARRWAERYLESFGAGRFADRARDILSAATR